MAHDVLICERCHTFLPLSAANRNGPVSCDRCSAVMTVDIFPAAFRATENGSDGSVLIDSENAGCYIHEERPAVASCGSCGKFLCSLCDVALLDDHYCTNCLEALQADPGKGAQLRSEYRRWEVLAAWLSLPALLFMPFLFVFFSPAALVLAVMGWHAPRGPVGRPRLLAGLLIVAHLLLIGLMIAFFIVGILSVLGEL